MIIGMTDTVPSQLFVAQNQTVFPQGMLGTMIMICYIEILSEAYL
jgi:hypothetical protein